VHATADNATFRIPHIIHHSAVTFCAFCLGPFCILLSAFRMPQFRILPTTVNLQIANMRKGILSNGWMN